jgi:hypothetical protein
VKSRWDLTGRDPVMVLGPSAEFYRSASSQEAQFAACRLMGKGIRL